MTDSVTIFDSYNLATFQDPSFPMLNEPENSTSGDFSVVIRMGDLVDEDQRRFYALSNFINDELEVLGVAKFQGYVFQYFSNPLIINREGSIQLQVGARLAAIEPKLYDLTCDDTGKIAEWAVNGNPVELDKVTETRMIDGEVTQVVTPVIVFEDGDDFYQIRIKTTDDFGWLKFSKAWKAGDRETVLTQIGDLSGKTYCNIGKLFTGLFNDKKFPAQGIVIPITGLVYDSEAKFGPQITAQVDCSEVSEDSVSVDYGKELVPTNQVQMVSFSQYHTGFKNMDIALRTGAVPTKAEPWYLWVKGMGKSPTTVPVHLVTTRLFPQMETAVIAAKPEPKKLAGGSKQATMKEKLATVANDQF